MADSEVRLMTVDKIEKRIEKLLSSDKRWPVIVDFSNKTDMKAFLHHFEVGNNEMLSAGQFCGNDGTIRFEEVADRIENNKANLFIINLSPYLKLYGENTLKSELRTNISKSIDGHVIIVTYQCRNYLKFSDSRFSERGQILIVDGEFDATPNIRFVSRDLAESFKNVYSGFQKLGDAFETSEDKNIYIATEVNKNLFGMSIIPIEQLTNGYDILCSKDTRIKNVPESFGEPKMWNNLLKNMGNNDLSVVLNNQLGTIEFESCVRKYPDYSDYKKWLFYISIALFGAKKNSYLSYALNAATDYKDIPRAIFRTILSIDSKDEDFSKMYSERKEILKFYVKYLDEVVDFCKVVSTKQDNAVFYLTDLTPTEKEKVFEWLDTYGDRYNIDELAGIFRKVYPDLANYLSEYHFDNDFLNDYFKKYKYQKVINKILPDFEALVEKQAAELSFVDILKPRTQLFDKVNLENSHAFFFDALGVEYLGFIQSKCAEYNLSAKITCGRCELPSLTCYNKDFVEVCNEKGCEISDIKDLDELKHHGEDNFDYEKTKLPIYLTSELEIIDKLLRKIKADIYSDHYEKGIIVSDHGASRLAVLHETENIWEMETKGEHSGRCCPKNEINTKPDFAIEESGYWVLANYDRFKGSRRANVEVHGGASIEEITIPIIEISRKSDAVEAFIMDEYREIILSAKEVPVLKIYVGVISDNISFKVNGKYYKAVKTEDKYIYEVELTECTKKGDYIGEIIGDSGVVSGNNKFKISKKGMTEVSLFD